MNDNTIRYESGKHIRINTIDQVVIFHIRLVKYGLWISLEKKDGQCTLKVV